jgi:hypothetical protein
MSITLSAGAISTKQVGGVTKETDATDALMTLRVDFQANNLVFTLVGGTLAGQVFTPGTAGDSIEVSIDLVSGRWLASNSATGLPATLSGAALNTLLTTLKSLRNTGETFAVNNSVVSGSQVAWT